jgi:hypothetical protein
MDRVQVEREITSPQLSRSLEIDDTNRGDLLKDERQVVNDEIRP